MESKSWNSEKDYLIIQLDCFFQFAERKAVRPESNLWSSPVQSPDFVKAQGIAMVQWVNRLWNNIFVNPPALPLLCEISGALHLAQPGLTAGWQADEIQVNFKIL